jgi:hypothetical protein
VSWGVRSGEGKADRTRARRNDARGSKQQLHHFGLGGGRRRGETRLAANWSIKLEYLYVDLGSISSTIVLTDPGGTFGSAPFTAGSHRPCRPELQVRRGRIGRRQVLIARSFRLELQQARPQCSSPPHPRIPGLMHRSLESVRPARGKIQCDREFCLRYRACRTSDEQGSPESQRKSVARGGSQTGSCLREREMASRENNRRVSNGEQYLMATAAALVHPVSRQWKGYWQRSEALNRTSI